MGLILCNKNTGQTVRSLDVHSGLCVDCIVPTYCISAIYECDKLNISVIALIIQI